MSRLFLILAQLDRGDLPGLPGTGDPDDASTGLSQANVTSIRNIALAVFAGIALIVLGYAGFKYVMSHGNPQETAKAQQTIIYALLGLIVAVFATTFISFVINRI